MKKALGTLSFLIVMVMLATNTPVMQGTGRYEVYDLVKTELSIFEELRSTNTEITDSLYNDVLTKFEEYRQNYSSKEEIEMVSGIISLYYMQSQLSKYDQESNKYKYYDDAIINDIVDLKRRINEYEIMNGIPR